MTTRHIKPAAPGAWVDLHLHSTCSDGTLSPAEVLARAAEAGMSAVSLCDHDNIDGIEEAMAAGAALGVEVLTGVELSVVWEDFQDIHLLGYGFDHKNPVLAESLRSFRAFRETRNEQIVLRVNEKLVTEKRAPLDLAEVRRRAGGTVGRPHIAMALIDAGYVKDGDEAFERYLVPCNVEKRFFPADEAIDLIHSAGGLAVLAHPPFITRDRAAYLELLDVFVGLGLDGIEAYNSGADNEEVDWQLTQARRRGLLVSGGSDFHGVTKEDIRIGCGRGNLKIPRSCYEDILHKLKRNG